MTTDAAATMTRDRFLRQSDVLEKVGCSEWLLNEMIAGGSFPKPAKIGARALRWSENEIDRWMAARLANRTDADDAGETTNE
jgi:prophage regulatory protein